MSEDLSERVMQFKTMSLPGQPMMMHMGTSYLVNDLWREVLRLQEAVEFAHAAGFEWPSDPIPNDR